MPFCVLTNDETDYSDEDYDEDYSLDLNSTTNGTLQFLKQLKNETKEFGQRVIMRCEVQNMDPQNVNLTKIKIKWYVNYVPIDNEDKRIKIFKKYKPETNVVFSRLRISSLNVHDMGYYSCEAMNGKLKISSEAYLKVHREPYGSTSGDLPKYEPAFPEKPIEHHSEFTTMLPEFNHKEHDEVLPTFTNGFSTLDGKPSQVVFTKNAMETTGQKSHFRLPNLSSNEPFCQIYTGTRCKEFFEDKYVFVQPPFSQKEIEEKLEQSFNVISLSNDLSANCAVFAKPSMCYSAFPLCIDESRTNMDEQALFTRKIIKKAQEALEMHGSVNQTIQEMYSKVRNEITLRRICREDCEHLENELCRVEYAIAKRHPVIGQALKLEECENLPEKHEKNAEFCLPLGIDRSQSVQEDDECFWGQGEDYRGIIETSMNGSRCMKWSFQLHIQISDHPELAGGHAYCRNPGGQESQPFCYVESTKRELCNVPKCATYMWIYISVAFLSLVILGIGSILYCCCIRSNKQNPRGLQNMNIPTADKNIYGNSRMNSPMELNPMLPPQQNNIPPLRHHGTNKSNYQNVPNYTYKEVQFIEELGEGAFGKVYKGELKMKTGKILVAVKALKENASAKTQADFQREIELISELKHPNIICLLGIIVKQEPMCMLFEFMSEGDLHEFLRANSPTEGKSLTQNEFLHIALQIALGMEYLSGNHYVHRDLAARNCLVSKDLIVKISDFGLSRDMYSCDYYRVQSKSLLPVRWMPPESILYGKFTTESDVWSYGVVLWEIYSYGLQPYYGYNNQEVINMIRSRKLLPCPEHCPSWCYALMVECWAELAVRRPSFGEICHRLKIWKHNGQAHTAGFRNSSERKFGHSSKSNSTSQGFENDQEPALTWERKSSHTLNESQSSLTSRASSLGGKTQSTSVSDQNSASRSKKSHNRDKNSDSRKNTVVNANANGDNFETTLTY